MGAAVGSWLCPPCVPGELCLCWEGRRPLDSGDLGGGGSTAATEQEAGPGRAGDSARGGGGRGLAGGWAGLHGDPWRERSIWRAAGVKAEVRRSGPGQKPSPLKLQPEEGVVEGGRGVESCFLHTRCRQPLGGQAQEPGCLSSPSLC